MRVSAYISKIKVIEKDKEAGMRLWDLSIPRLHKKSISLAEVWGKDESNIINLVLKVLWRPRTDWVSVMSSTVKDMTDSSKHVGPTEL